MELKNLAFNADVITELEIIHLLKHLDIDIAVETGTSYGSTSLVLSDIVKQVYTVELKEDVYKETKEKLSRCKNINFYLGSSEKMLETIFHDIKKYKDNSIINKILSIVKDENEKKEIKQLIPVDHIFFYLDAHWYDYWPILDELEIISKHYKDRAIIVIDDFKVPNRDFGFTIDYNTGNVLDFKYIQDKIEKVYPNGYTYWYDDIYSLRPGYEDKQATGKFYVVPKNVNIDWLKVENGINYSNLLRVSKN